MDVEAEEEGGGLTGRSAVVTSRELVEAYVISMSTADGAFLCGRSNEQGPQPGVGGTCSAQPLPFSGFLLARLLFLPLSREKIKTFSRENFGDYLGTECVEIFQGSAFSFFPVFFPGKIRLLFPASGRNYVISVHCVVRLDEPGHLAIFALFLYKSIENIVPGSKMHTIF